MVKKLLCVLFICYLLVLQTGISKSVATVEKPDNLKEFLKEFDEVTVKYEYPSLRLAAVNTKGTVLPAGTSVVLRSTENLNSENIVSGSTVRFQVLEDVKVNGKILVKAGSMAKAQITFAKKSGIGGGPGKISVSDFSVNAVDGTYVPLNATIDAKGEHKYWLAHGVGWLLCLPFLFIKGEEVNIPAGTTKSVYTITDVSINAESL